MYNIIKQEHEGGLIELDRACSALGVSRSGYADWLKREHHPDPFEMNVRNEMQKIALEFTRYGYRRMAMELRRRGLAVNHKRVLRLMRHDNLLCARRLFKPVTTSSNHGYRTYPNLAKGMELTGLNQLWVSDITYIRLPYDCPVNSSTWLQS